MPYKSSCKISLRYFLSVVLCFGKNYSLQNFVTEAISINIFSDSCNASGCTRYANQYFTHLQKNKKSALLGRSSCIGVHFSKFGTIARIMIPT